MAAELKCLAFDLGAESGRAVLGRLGDGKLSLADVHRFPNGGIAIGESLFWDSLRLFSEMKQGLRLAVQAHGEDISSAGLDTWGVDFALLGPDDVLLENPHCYRDSRIDGMMDEALKAVPREEIYRETGIQFMPINTLYHLLYLAKNRRWMLDNAKSMLMIPDLFNFWFTGEKACEFTEATTSQLYNPSSGGWAFSLLEKLDIPTHFLTRIVPPGTLLGEIRQSVAEETGAPRMAFVAPACHDTGSAVAAVPARGESYAYISCGTWSLMGIESNEPIISEQALAFNLTNEGGVGNTFRVLRNIMGLWLVQECRRTWALSGREFTYSQLTEMAEAAKPFRSIVDPDDVRFLKPGDMPSRIREYCRQTNQPSPEDEGAVVRTALDSLALRYRWTLDRLEMLAGRRLDTVHMVGGGTQNTLLCRLAANTMNRLVIAGPVEATAIGNILVQGMALGHVGSLSDAREIVRNSFELRHYEPRYDGHVEEAYEKFKELLTFVR